MSFCSLQAGHGSSAGAIDYPLRELARDALERELQRELDAWAGRHEQGPGAGPEDLEHRFGRWLTSNDSPLLLLNVEEFVLDPEAHLRALAERVEGQAPARLLTGPELTGETGDVVSVRRLAEELKARLGTFAELDGERVLATPRRRGTPKGRTRTHYVLLVSPPRDLSNAEFKRFILEVVSRRWPGAVVAGYIHRDTDNTHLHLWLSAETTSGKKIDVRRVTASGDPALDKYPDLDEEIARELSRHFRDPSIYEDHVAKKLEWVYWRERFEQALARGERPPIMPYRARHDYDHIGQVREIAVRDRGKSRARLTGVEEAAPVPRVKSLAGALELWGKTIHLEVRVKYRRELLASLEVWRDQIDYPAEGVKQCLEAELAKAERDYGRHKEAYERTLDNRSREGYPKLKYPLHNAKQVSEMEEIARLTRDADLLRYVRSYTSLDRPGGGEALAREIGLRWGDEIEARLEVIERADALEHVASTGRGAASALQGDDGSATVSPPLDKDLELIRGWFGGWDTAHMRSCLRCFDDDVVRRHAERYVRAREYHEAAREAFTDSRAVAGRITARPVLDDSQVERMTALLGRASCGMGKSERAFLREVAALVTEDRAPSAAAFKRLARQSAPAGPGSEDAVRRTDGTPTPLDVLCPHDGHWVGRLILSAELKAVSALTLAACGGESGRFESAVDGARAARAILDLARSVRRDAGVAEDPPAATPSASERRSLERQLQAITQRLRERDLDWTADRIAAVEEFMDCLPPGERRRAELAVGRERSRLEERENRERLERVRATLGNAGELYVRSAYRAEGLDALRDPARFDGRVSELAGLYARIVADGGVAPERSGLDEKGLREAARLKLAAAVERYEREEREIADLSRLEARGMLAEHLSAAAQLRREWFERHWPLVQWSYRNTDGRGQASLAGAYAEIADQLRRGDRADGPRLLICQDQIKHIIEATQPELDRLSGEEARSRAEWLELRAEHEGRLRAHQDKGLRVDGPRFTEEEWAKLEVCAAETRNVALNEFITDVDEVSRGLEYAARRAAGRALSAEAIQHAEYKLSPKFDRPPDAGKLEPLPSEARQRLTSAFAVHAAAREAEKSAAFSYSAELRRRAEELGGRFKAETGREPRPLLSPWEAGLVASTYGTMDTHSRYRWDKKLARAEVEALAENRPGAAASERASHPALGEWKAKNMAATTRDPAGRFQKSMEGRDVIGYSEARAIVREQARIQSRERSSPSRGGR